MKQAIAFLLLCSCMSLAQTFSVLHQFRGKADGAIPVAGIMIDSQNNLYGTTEEGGSKLTNGLGIIYKIDPVLKKETILLRFKGAKTGSHPMAGVQGQGTLYGTTQTGGTANHGTVYKIDSLGQVTVLHSFTRQEQGPSLPVTVDGQGNVYGAYQQNVFKIDQNGGFSILQRFSQGGVSSPFILGQDGNLYGTTAAGTGGTLFQMTPAGQFTTLFTFGLNGEGFPSGPIAVDQAGTFYGVTGSTSPVLYSVDSVGRETILYRFSGAVNPNGVTMDAAGNLYGSTQSGGLHGFGTVFGFSQGTFRTLYDFKGINDGGFPYAGISVEASGNLVGAASSYGLYGKGTIFRLSF